MRGLVYIGLISYPLYLWHWPLLSFLQITEGGAPSTSFKIGAIVLALILAALTFHLVERPVRAVRARDESADVADAPAHRRHLQSAALPAPRSGLRAQVSERR